ncbi:MAG: cobalamin-binding protein [Phycisphaerae bacterium]|nr:cobalamin-binding protein [Phycisphaerae bacterium]
MPALRVVSLLPSATELLCAAGGEAMLVGRSHECDVPASIRDRPVLTGQRTHATDSRSIDEEVRASLNDNASLYTLDAKLLAELRPDVILTQDLCAVCSIDLQTVRRIAAGMPREPRIVSLDPHDVFQVLDDLLTVGAAIGLERSAETAMVALRDRYWRAVDCVNPYVTGPEIAFLEWMDPIFVGGHWTPQLIEAAGGRHSLNLPKAKSRQITPEELLESAPERVIICPCGYDIAAIQRELPALRAQRWWPLLPAVMNGESASVAIVDGNRMFNRPGPRLVDAFEWLVGWINDRPELIPPDFPAIALPR